MKVEAKAVRCYEIIVDGLSYGLFYKKSEWNGLLELRGVNSDEKLIIGDTNLAGLTEVFGILFGGEGETKPTYIVSGSPDLIAEMKGASPAGKDSDDA